MTTKLIFKAADFSTYAISNATELVLTSSMMSAGQARGDGTIQQTAGFANRIAITDLTSVSEYNQVYVPSALKYSIVWFDENGNSTNIDGSTPAFWTDGTDEWINIQDIAANAWQYNGNTTATKFRISFGLISNTDLNPEDIDQYNVKLRYSIIEKSPLLLTADMMRQGLLTGQGNIVGATSENPGGTYSNRISSNRKFNITDYSRIVIPTGYKWVVVWFKPDDTPLDNVTTAPTTWTQTTGTLSLDSAVSFTYTKNAAKFMISIGASDNSTLDATQVESYGIYLYPASYTD